LRFMSKDQAEKFAGSEGVSVSHGE
jgi:hypothetical protein